MKKILLLILPILLCISCTENYSNAERIGVITKFGQAGLMWKSYEGELHVTQTGMNSTMTDFNFSIDNDREEPQVVSTLDSAAKLAWKVKLTYHQTLNKNWFSNRGHTNCFVSNVEVLDKNMNTIFNNKANTSDTIERVNGRTIDTVWVVIDKSQVKLK